MLNRRYLRIKVMQALYAYFQSDVKDLNKSEKQLLSSIHKIYDLYLYLLSLLLEIRDHAERVLEDAKSKRLPTAEDLSPNKKFIENKFLIQLSKNAVLQKELNARKISWQNEPELIKKIFNAIRSSDEYSQYLASDNDSYKSHKNFIEDVYKHEIAGLEAVHNLFEEIDIYWTDDIDFVNVMVIKTINSYSESATQHEGLFKLYKDAEEDKEFVEELFRKTIIHEETNEKYIGDKTKNWEVDRIAMMDVLLMKMAITEVLHFPSIPVKVSLNEYIELSKMYSTPKSKLFINGILDKLVMDFKTNKQIKKVGRGLME
jgi:N utilization substance protein B